MPEGVARYEAARAIDGQHALTQVLASALDMETGKYPEALAEVGKALEIQGASPWILAQRGMVRRRRGDTTAARADLEQASARRGPFSAHGTYALSLLTTGKSEDEALFARERQTLRDTKNIDDRLSCRCAHPLVRLREGRAKEADAWIQEAGAFAADKGEQGTLLRCGRLPSYADGVRGRFEQAEVKVAMLSSVWEGFGAREDGRGAGQDQAEGPEGHAGARKRGPRPRRDRARRAEAPRLRRE
ncbi:hypothetical protein [Polyangium mundeleinium]|uniref:Tetratricopeptide repeat protein n=1 Tax=Polyangium mundeleinium TaxID=2995306 RepID=A0ABT5ENW3_9BACT|nr:hypothetical protein [Polyangium mundeleinium]MDC0743537.1 hypothetical protein [Polyangium mundeleinium]